MRGHSPSCPVCNAPATAFIQQDTSNTFAFGLIHLFSIERPVLGRRFVLCDTAMPFFEFRCSLLAFHRSLGTFMLGAQLVSPFFPLNNGSFGPHRFTWMHSSLFFGILDLSDELGHILISPPFPTLFYTRSSLFWQGFSLF